VLRFGFVPHFFRLIAEPPSAENAIFPTPKKVSAVEVKTLFALFPNT
jgi:hypothetical protein